MFGAINAPSYVGRYEHRADIPYGPLPRQQLDVYVPRGASGRPTVVFWYGGMWKRGTKDWYRFVGAALANSGYVAILPDYRLFPTVRFPQFIDDGALAVKWAHEHARELGGDPGSIFLMGHSAGAHLAATVALDERYLQAVGGSRRWIRGWISLSAPYELKWMMPDVYQIIGSTRPPEQWRPIALVSNRAPPALLVHGLEDTTIHPLEAVHMSEKLLAAGVPVECRIYTGASHMDTVLALSPLFRFEGRTLADVRGFIDRTVAASPPDSSDFCPDVSGRKEWAQPLPQPTLVELPW